MRGRKHRPHDSRVVHQLCTPRTNGYFADPSSTYVDALLALKNNDSSKIIVASLVGPASNITTEPSDFEDELALESACPEASGHADPAIRLTWFADQFLHSMTPSVCEPDSLGTILAGIGCTTASAILDQEEDEDQDEDKEDTTDTQTGNVVNGCNTSGGSQSPLWAMFFALFLSLRVRSRRLACIARTTALGPVGLNVHACYAVRECEVFDSAGEVEGL